MALPAYFENVQQYSLNAGSLSILALLLISYHWLCRLDTLPNHRHITHLSGILALLLYAGLIVHQTAAIAHHGLEAVLPILWHDLQAAAINFWDLLPNTEVHELRENLPLELIEKIEWLRRL